MGYFKGDPLIHSSTSTREMEGRTWGHFSGKNCPLPELIRQCQLIEQIPVIFDVVFRTDPTYTWLEIYPDASGLFQGCPKHVRDNANISRSCQWDLQQWLCQSYGQDELFVVLLAVFDEHCEYHAFLGCCCCVSVKAKAWNASWTSPLIAPAHGVDSDAMNGVALACWRGYTDTHLCLMGTPRLTGRGTLLQGNTDG